MNYMTRNCKLHCNNYLFPCVKLLYGFNLMSQNCNKILVERFLVKKKVQQLFNQQVAV